MKYEIYFTGFTIEPHASDAPPMFMEDRQQYSLEHAQKHCTDWNAQAVNGGYIRDGETCYEPRINPEPLPTEQPSPERRRFDAWCAHAGYYDSAGAMWAAWQARAAVHPELDFLDSLMQRKDKSDMHFIPDGFCLLFIRDSYGRVVKSGSGKTAREAIQGVMK